MTGADCILSSQECQDRLTAAIQQLGDLAVYSITCALTANTLDV